MLAILAAGDGDEDSGRCRRLAPTPACLTATTPMTSPGAWHDDWQLPAFLQPPLANDSDAGDKGPSDRRAGHPDHFKEPRSQGRPHGARQRWLYALRALQTQKIPGRRQLRHRAHEWRLCQPPDVANRPCRAGCGRTVAARCQRLRQQDTWRAHARALGVIHAARTRTALASALGQQQGCPGPSGSLGGGDMRAYALPR